MASLTMRKRWSEAARTIAAQRVTAQAAQHGAEFVICGEHDLSIKVREVPCGYANCQHATISTWT